MHATASPCGRSSSGQQARNSNGRGAAGRPIRIARVIARLNVGGPAVYTISLTAGLEPTQFKQWLVAGVAASHEGDMLAEADARGVRPIIVPHLGRAIDTQDDLRAFSSLVRLFRRLRPDIVETHTAKAGVVGRLAAWATGVPVTVHTFHGHVFHSYFSPVRSAIVRRIEQLLALRTTRIIALGPAQRAEIMAYGVGRSEQVVAVPIGLELGPYRASRIQRGRLREELGIEPDTKLVGIVARLTAIKAHEVFLKAATAVRRLLPNARFIVVGEGERRAELAQLAEDYGLAPAVHWLGWRRDLPAVYADLDVVALTSRNEGLPTALVEAMAAGRPVVATRVGGVPTLVAHGETGLLTASGDTSALASSLLAVLCNRQLAERLGAAARDAVYPAYDLSTFLPRMANFYRGLVTR
ncbi:MAG: glycosyl transferase [Dehalococcoidia bacterium]|nr:glycosyl transferase [Dehalococcoidia bacterium]